MVAGNIADVAYGLQSAQGAPASGPLVRTELTDGGVAPVRTIIDLEETSGSRLRLTSVPSKVSVGGEPTIYGRPNALALAFLMALGSESVAGGGDPYVHTIVSAGSLPYGTWWRMLGSLIFEQFTDVKLGKLVVTSEAGQPLKAQCTLVGILPQFMTSGDYGTLVTVVDLEDDTPFMHYDGSGLFTVDGDPVSCIEKAVLTIDNHSVDQQGDSLVPCAITDGLLEITWELTHTIEDPDLYNLFHYGSASPSNLDEETRDIYEPAAGIDIKWDKGGSPDHYIQVQTPRVQLVTLDGYTPNVSGDALKDVQTYRVYEPASPTLPITVTASISDPTFPATS